MEVSSLALIVAGSGGSGAISTATLLLEAAGKWGWYAYLTRSVGAQIRGGEAVAQLRIGDRPLGSHDDHFQILIALDWRNLGKFAAEMPLSPTSLIIGDPDQGDVPPELLASGARLAQLPMGKMAQAIPGGRANMIALGALAGLLGLPRDAIEGVLVKEFGHKGEKALNASRAAIDAGARAATELPEVARLPAPAANRARRWTITGNQATGLGALRGGVRFVAAYPITPATEVIEWMAPALDKLGGVLVQAEDELAAINQIIGASYGGIPAMTATSGPGYSLMTESIGLAVASETPIVVVDVMRGGPSTGIPAKSEQSDLAFAVSGLHGDAPRLVLAPNSIADCITTTHWAVQLAEALQAPAIVLSDQFMGQSRAIIDRPADDAAVAQRLTAAGHTPDYKRYRDTPSGVSPMAIPGTPGVTYTADGLEHTELGVPSSQARDHRLQLDKRERKLALYDYGPRWADIERPAGGSELAVITFGSVTGSVREAVARAAAQGVAVRLISLRLLAPALPERMDDVLAGVRQVLVVEQNHGAQLLRYLRAMYDLPGKAASFHRPGPLPLRAAELTAAIVEWARAHQAEKETA